MFLMGEALTGEVVLFVCLYEHIGVGVARGQSPLMLLYRAIFSPSGGATDNL